MKTLLSLFLLTSILCFSCDEGGGNTGPIVVFNKDTLQVSENINGDSKPHVVLISSIFQSPTGEALTIEVTENSNTDLVTLTVKNDSALFQLKPNGYGFSKVGLRASLNGQSAAKSFILYVKGSPGTVGYTEGKTAFEAGNWAEAELKFSAALTTPKYMEAAYTGVGYALIFLGKDQSAHTILTSGLNAMPDSKQIRSGLVFLEHATDPQGNHTKVISNAEKILPETSSTFSMVWDSNINEKDIRYVMAKSYADNNLYDNALVQIKLIDSGFTGTTKSEILAKLESLASELK